jgi:GT2 family glycosyltransferase
MKITYTVQVCNESRELFSLLNLLTRTIDDEDEINVVVDINNVTSKVEQVLKHFGDRINIFRRPFDGFGKNDNFHKEIATGEYIFGLDADEMPQETLIKSVKRIIEDTGAEVIAVPRINIHPGITEQEVKDFGFNINEVGFINWPDYQMRIYKKCDHIYWTDELHTKLTGTDNAVGLKPSPSCALWHVKSMEKQKSRWKLDETNNYTISSPTDTNLYDLLM